MHWKEKQGGGNVLGRDEGLHPTGAAGNLGSTALLHRLLPADAAKTIFLALILRTPPSLPLLVIVGARFRGETCQVSLAF